MIIDSGNRETFDTGAVRDIQKGKGRCDLMPLEVAAAVLCHPSSGDDCVLNNIAAFQDHKKTSYLHLALSNFADIAYKGDKETMLLDVSKRFEEGAEKYGEDNWRKGLPVGCYINSAVRHYLKYRRGDNEEDNAAAFVWNIMCCIWEVDYHRVEN